MEPHRSSGILLNEDRFLVEYRDQTRECLCRVTFDLTREHHVLIDCMDSLHELVSSSNLPWFRSEEPFRVLVPGTERPVECYISGTFQQQIIGDDPSVYLTFWPLGGFVGSSSQLSKIGGGIVNFKQCHFAIDRIIRLGDGTWSFELTPVGDSRFLYPAQIQNTSYRFTHHLLLRRSDDRPFSLHEAEKALETLSTFLSFCAERWVAPALITGFDQLGAAATQNWGTARVDTFKNRRNWLDDDHGSAIAEAFPGFARLMEDAEWRETIRSAVYWYVRGDTNHVGPDGAIILIQTALERLAWHILVKVRRSISEHSFSNIPAADQLRLVLDTSSIPLDLPTQLGQLAALAVGQKGGQDWVDGPQAFVAIRNQIVHPGKHKRARGGRAFFEALQLGKWYLELILLRSFGFNGSYASRLNIPMYAGCVETVPWAKQGT